VLAAPAHPGATIVEDVLKGANFPIGRDELRGDTLVHDIGDKS